MALAPGDTLGPYDILSPLGSGGMGAVYRARDRRLQRDVAVKVLREDGPLDDAARARFEREARSIAALNHPHICAVYDVGADHGTDYIVMELVEGETLAARLARGPLPLAETLRCGIQIAVALDAAHRAGIVHRDLKPANVMLTRGGLKLLDFGLARCAPIRTSPEGMTETSPALLSEPGVLMGTWPYMAPEQILGQPVDARTDVFAFGIVFHEMLTGTRPFQGDSAPRIMAAILERDAPSLATAVPGLPRALSRVVDKCLAKPVEARWQSMRDLADELRWIEDDIDRPSADAPAAPTRRRWLPWLIPAAAVLGLAAGVWLVSSPAPPAASVVRFAIAPSELDTDNQSPPEISPDGQQVLFVARPRAGGTAGLYLHDLASGATRRLDGTDGAASPFWSGDGRSVGYVAGRRLMRTEVAGGTPRAVMDVPDAFLGAAWNRDDALVVSLRYGLYRMPSAGGTPIQVTSLDRSRQENSHRWPQFLPDGQRFVFVARSGRPDKSSAYVGFLDGRPPARLMEASAQVRYAPSGHLLYMQDGTLLARAVDRSTLAFTGEPVRLADEVRPQGTGLRARYSVSGTGAFVYQRMGEQRFPLRWYDRTGRALGALGAPDTYSNFRISPDGTRVVIDLNDNPRGGRSVWIVDVATGNRTRVTFGESDDWQPIWSRDGERVLYGSYRNGPLDLYQRRADGTTPTASVIESEVQKIPHDWSKDGRTLLVSELTAERLNDIVAYTVDGSAKTAVASSGAVEVHARFSPDDRWVAYQSDESGRSQIYVQPFPPTGVKWQVTTAGGVEPHWHGDGRELYYLEPGRGVMALAVDAMPVFRQAPVLLVPTRTAVVSGGSSTFDVTADGRRFLVRERADTAELAPMQVILNWPALMATDTTR
jgi:serine/threonine protein kinase/Tol biopolymer transport system component